MSLDIDAILDKFVLIARDALPTGLSSIGASGTLPAVIRSRQKGPKPSYPYCVLDLLSIVDDGWLIGSHIDSSDFTVYETNKNLLLNFRVYGGNAITLVNTLHGFLRLNRVLNDIRKTTGGAVVTVGDIDQLPILLSDEHLESASFNIVFAITDTFVDSSGSDSFNKVILDGELKFGADDPSPIDIDITAP